MTVPSTTTPGGILLWTLLLSDAAALAVLLFTLWRLQRLQRVVDVCVWANTITFGHKSISLGHYLLRRFNIRVSHGLSRAEAATLKTHLASLGEGKGTLRILGRPDPALREPRHPPTAARPSGLDEFPDEEGLSRRG